MRQVVTKAVVVVLSVAVLAEIILRYQGMYATYAEANGRAYVTEYGQTYPTWYHTHQALDTFTPTVADFHYPYITNSLGIRDIEHQIEKPDSMFRIAIFGDSYAEGVGAPIDSNWAALLQLYTANATHRKVEVINGGVSGCDPYFNYVMYRDKISLYKPDLVIASVNATDYSDIMLRGGMERFVGNGSTQYTAGPWYELIFEKSRLFRALLHKIGGYDLTGIFISRYEYKHRLPTINNGIMQVLKQFKNTAQANHSKFAVLVYAIPPEIVYKKHKITAYNTEALKALSQQLAQEGFETIDLRDELNKRYSNSIQASYTYVNDLHYRPSGYAAIAYMLTDTLLLKELISKKAEKANTTHDN